MSDASMNPNDSAPFDPTPEGSLSHDMPLHGADEFGDQETAPAMDESSWLLEEDGSSGDPDFEHTSVHALPEAFAQPPQEARFVAEDGPGAAAEEAGAFEDDLVGASYVEPESSGSALSKALVPGSIALLLSFGGVGGWAFMKQSKNAAAPDSVVAVKSPEPDAPEPEPEVELVRPDDSGNEPSGRMSYQRDGAIIPAEGYGTVKTAEPTVASPREPGELPQGGSEPLQAEPMNAEGPDGSVDRGEDGNDELDIEFGTYVDSGETSLFEGGDPERESLHVQDGEAGAVGSGDDGSEPSVDSLSPTFLDGFVLNIEPLDEEAAAMLNGLGGDAPAKITTGSSDGEVASSAPELRVAPLTGDEVYGSLAWTDYSANGMPMSPAVTYFDQIEEVQAAGMDVAQDGADAPEGETDSSLPNDYMPFGYFDDNRASLDVEPDIRSLEVTETGGPAPQPASDSAPQDEQLADSMLRATSSDDNLTVGSRDSMTLSQEPAPSSPAGEEVAGLIEDAPEDEESVIGAESVVDAVTSEEEAPTEEPMMKGQPEDIALADAHKTSIDLNDAHARLDAIFGPTPVEGDPVALAIVPTEPSLAEAGEEVRLGTKPETTPEISDEFAAPETLAGTDEAVNSGGVEIELADGAIGDVTLSGVDAPVPGPSADSDPVTVAIHPDAADVGPAPALDVASEPAVEPDLEASLNVAPPQDLTEPSPRPAPDLVAATPVETDATTPAIEAPVDVAAAEVPWPGVVPEPSIDASTDVPGLDSMIAPEPAPVEPAVALELEPEAAQPAPEEVAVEVLPSIVDEVKAPRRGSVLNRVGKGEIWPHRTVPKSKLKGEMFVLTPKVGQVRIVFDGGDTIDGRLHGVGNNKITLDTRLGRLTLDARRVDRMDRLGGNSQRATSGEVSTKGLQRVRVQADGGVFLGHLLAREGNRVTLLLSEGMRVTLESDDIRPAGRQKTVSRLRRPK